MTGSGHLQGENWLAGWDNSAIMIAIGSSKVVVVMEGVVVNRVDARSSGYGRGQSRSERHSSIVSIRFWFAGVVFFSCCRDRL